MPSKEVEGTKVVKVYDGNDNFTIEVPESCEITMQYFNPTRENEGAFGGGRNHRGTHKSTRLSIKHNGKQIAVFLGVEGFREESKVKLTRVVKRMVVEEKLEDDGEGNRDFSSKKRREITMVSEDGVYD